MAKRTINFVIELALTQLAKVPDLRPKSKDRRRENLNAVILDMKLPATDDGREESQEMELNETLSADRYVTVVDRGREVLDSSQYKSQLMPALPEELARLVAQNHAFKRGILHLETLNLDDDLFLDAVRSLSTRYYDRRNGILVTRIHDQDD